MQLINPGGNAMMRESFGDLIRSNRRKLNLSLQDVAEAIGVTAVYVSEVERGKRPPFVTERLPALAERLKIELNDLLRAAWSVRKVIDFDPEAGSEKQFEALATLARGGLSEAELDDILEIVNKKQRKMF
jgi:transcriptional regulator with XRE-family HTH domain